MADGMNRVMLVGNLGTDPDLRYGKSGTAVLKLRLATSDSWIDKNQEKQTRTEWHDVVLFGNRAIALSKHLSKGQCLFVEGALSTSSYEVEGVKKYRTEVIARDVVFMGSTRKLAPSRPAHESVAPQPSQQLDAIPF